jgi:hypothetical protein
MLWIGEKLVFAVNASTENDGRAPIDAGSGSRRLRHEPKLAAEAGSANAGKQSRLKPQQTSRV